MNTILVFIATLFGLASLLEGCLIIFLIRDKRHFASKVKTKASETIFKQTTKYSQEVNSLRKEMRELRRQQFYCRKELNKWKQKARDYAFAMQDISELYSKACGAISDHLREGFLIKSFSDSDLAYEHFNATWKNLQYRKVIQTYNFQDILDCPDDLEYLFGTSDLNALSEVFQIK